MKSRLAPASRFVARRGYRLALSAAAALLALALVTLPPGAGRAAQVADSVTFAVIGDFGSGDTNELDVANLVKGWTPDFIVTVGDNNYPDGEAATIDANIGRYYHEYMHPYSGAYGAGAAENRFWPSVGNRDYENQAGAPLQPYLDYFTLPGNERYYDFVRGPVHFFVVNSDSREPHGVESTSTQALWLKGRLAASTAPWKLVVMHHPPFSSRTSWPKLQWPFREWGATAVLTGHAHIYERILKDGLPYITNGLGGESLGSFSTAIEGSIVRFGSDYGAMRVRATSTFITFEFITRRGVVVDSYSIERNSPAPAAPSNLSAAPQSPTQINLTWADNSTNEDGFKVERSTDRVNFTRVATLGPNVNAYSDTGLQPATAYHYRVAAFNSTVDSGYSNTASATTTDYPPAAPSNLTASALPGGQVSLSWADNSANETGFEVERCAGAGCTNFQTRTEVGAGATTYSDGGLVAGTVYRYRVRAFNGSGDSDFSNEAEATALGGTSDGKPAAPGGLSATAVSSVQINLAWADNSTNEDGFKLYRSVDNATFSRIATLGAGVTAYSDGGRAAGTTYYYRVLAYNAAGNSANSNTASATTFPPATSVPAAPSNLTATPLSGTQVRLGWADNSVNEDGFKLYRSPDGKNFTQVAKPPANVTTHTDSGVASRQTYYYRIRAYNAAGNSAYSNTVKVTTP
ncbi:MAG TPA: fibronectin type III domain-containing protein [Pyrinomonadaceae bacterium]|nr:fibronectin type III domain-containing protein [Pyrinomonadaceae bacterium]